MAPVISPFTWSSFGDFWRGTLDAALPPLCIACEGATSSPHGFCGACWRGLSFITPPSCSCCGLPFAYEALAQGEGQAVLCGACIEDRPVFQVAKAPLTYNDAIRPLILSFKHQDRTDLAPAFARLMKTAGEDLLGDVDVLVPVPLHPFRLLARRYNQSALLARNLAKASAKKVLLHVLRRRRHTPSQGRLSRAQRKANVKGAFMVPARLHKVIRRQKVLLVDDVMTTGATLNACAETLLAAGAASVKALVLARVVKAEI